MQASSVPCLVVSEAVAQLEALCSRLDDDLAKTAMRKRTPKRAAGLAAASRDEDAFSALGPPDAVNETLTTLARMLQTVRAFADVQFSTTADAALRRCSGVALVQLDAAAARDDGATVAASLMVLAALLRVASQLLANASVHLEGARDEAVADVGKYAHSAITRVHVVLTRHEHSVACVQAALLYWVPLCVLYDPVDGTTPSMDYKLQHEAMLRLPVASMLGKCLPRHQLIHVALACASACVITCMGRDIVFCCVCGVWVCASVQ